LKIRVGHLAFVVQEDIDLAVAFEPRDRIDRDPPVLCRHRHGQVLLGAAFWYVRLSSLIGSGRKA